MTDYVFISYSRKDQAYTRRLADELRGRGFSVWNDDRIDFGDRWWQTIVQAIRDSSALIVVMTPDSEESEWVEREVQLALSERKPVFPLLLSGKGFALLITRQYANVTDGEMPAEDFYHRLERVIPALGTAEAPLVAAERGESVAPILPRQPFEPEMIFIPAGDFAMGSDPQKDPAANGAEQPQHDLHLPAYHVAKTPVTNALYLSFVQATNCQTPSYWREGQPLAGQERHPVVGVNWYDAVAYCDWLSEVTGKPYRLPSEAEWEMSARGSDGRIYPWGDRWEEQRCNTAASGRWSTTPVDAYLQGASPYGLLDMAGNVWEWTQSLYKSYPYDPSAEAGDSDEQERRVLRGGSYGYKAAYARCAFRLRLNPDSRGRDIGFRLVLSSSRER
jgi:formylglycine-generating enzyme required for sulfatase activity